MTKTLHPVVYRSSDNLQWTETCPPLPFKGADTVVPTKSHGAAALWSHNKDTNEVGGNNRLASRRDGTGGYTFPAIVWTRIGWHAKDINDEFYRYISHTGLECHSRDGDR